MPPELEPSRFSDWSSIASPPARTSPHHAPDVPIEQNGNTQRQERGETSNSGGVTSATQTDVLRDNQDITARPTLVNIGTGPQGNDLEPNEENVDIIPPVPIRSAWLSLHTEDMVLIDAPRGSSANDNVTRSSQVRTHDIEGISSI